MFGIPLRLLKPRRLAAWRPFVFCRCFALARARAVRCLFFVPLLAVFESLIKGPTWSPGGGSQ